MKVFCDFDGTAAQNDVGSLLFRTFAGDRCFEIITRWKAGEISSRQCVIEECSISRVNRAQLGSFADGQKLDPEFPAFVRFCHGKDVEVEIVSDGLDFYIERILNNHGLLGKIGVHANQLVFEPEDRISARFPYFGQGCGQCGNCKGFHVKQARPHYDTLVYVGDGLSDRCGAIEADIVFAKRGRDLIRYCEDNAISCHEFSDFREVREKLKQILQA